MVADFDAEIAAHRIVVIETAGKVSGYMIAWPEADAYFIDNIAVDPACQGEGLGRRLMEYAVAEADRFRLRALRLYTNVLMIENLSMYAHLGFVETHRGATEKGFNVVYMQRSLPGFRVAQSGLRYPPQRALTRTAAILGCRFTGCMNSHSK